MSEGEKDILAVVILFIVIIAFVSFFAGVLNGSKYYKDKCSYKSIISRITIPYILGCELGKPRWKNVDN